MHGLLFSALWFMLIYLLLCISWIKYILNYSWYEDTLSRDLSLWLPTFSEVVTTFSQRHTIPVTSVPGARHSTILGILPVASGIWNNRVQVSLGERRCLENLNSVHLTTQVTEVSPTYMYQTCTCVASFIKVEGQLNWLIHLYFYSKYMKMVLYFQKSGSLPPSVATSFIEREKFI